MYLLPAWKKKWTAGAITVFALIFILMFNVTYSGATDITLSAAALSGSATYSDGKISTPKNILADTAFIEAGYNNVFIVKSDGTVWAWGSNSIGTLGDGPDSSGRQYPVQLRGANGVGYLTDVVALYSYFWRNYALKSDGTVWAWGSNSSNELWIGSEYTNASYPMQVRGAGGIGYLTNITAIAAGNSRSAALKSDGTVWTWGSNISISTVATVSGNPLQNVTSICAGGFHGLGLKSDGTVWTWGSNITAGATSYYPLGYTTSAVYTRQVGDINGATAVAATNYHSFVLKSDGTVWTWGDTASPVQLPDLTNTVAISSGPNFILALKSDGHRS